MKHFIFISISALLIMSCGGEKKSTEVDKGIGPIDQLELKRIDIAQAQQGKKLFQQHCALCHKTHEEFLGPEIRGVFERRSPEWIMNMILNPEEMVKNNPTAKELHEKYKLPMPVPEITRDEAFQIFEYMRTIE